MPDLSFNLGGGNIGFRASTAADKPVHHDRRQYGGSPYDVLVAAIR